MEQSGCAGQQSLLSLVGQAKAGQEAEASQEAGQASEATEAAAQAAEAAARF